VITGSEAAWFQLDLKSFKLLLPISETDGTYNPQVQQVQSLKGWRLPVLS